jgi:predicted nucleotidyltransferase
MKMNDKINNLIFKNPEKWIHIRGIARKLRLSPETVRKHLAVLKRQEIVEGRKEGNLLQFRANLENENYKHKKILHNLRAIYDSGIAGFLYEYYHPKAIVLFGSYARGEDLSRSDIDIGIVTSNKKRPHLSGFEKRLARKINLSLFTRKEVSNEFFTNIINGVVLKGVLKNE